MKPEMIMMIGNTKLMPVNTLLVPRGVTRAPRISSPVGKMEYEASRITKSVETGSRLVISRGWLAGRVDRQTVTA